LLPAEANAINGCERDSFIEINPNGIHVDLNPNKGAQVSRDRDLQRRILALPMPLICGDHLCFPVACVCSSGSISKLERLTSPTFAQ
jgi:hypothetical protein